MRKFRDETIGPVFTRSNILKLSRLLDMLYKPSEIGEEIGVTVEVIYHNYLPAGCPHRRDANNLIWINGTEFAAWARSVNQANKKKLYLLEENEAWCVHCNQVVVIVGPRERRVRRNLVMVQGKCAICAGKVNRLKSGKEEVKRWA